MKDSIKDILKTLPDFDDLMALSNKMAEVQLTKLSLDAQIKLGESNVFKEAFTSPEYFQNGKAPSAAYVESALKYPGLKGELVQIRQDYAVATVELDKLKVQMDIYKTLIEVWRTLSSNERAATLS
jgi:hypothetical protein